MRHVGNGFYVNSDARFYAFGVRVPLWLWRLLYGTPRYVNVGDVLPAEAVCRCPDKFDGEWCDKCQGRAWEMGQ